MKIERRIYKATLEDIRKYVGLRSKGHYKKYVMIENSFLNDPDSNSEIYIDTLGPDRANCSSTMFGEITPDKTYLINKDICGRYCYYVDFDEFCEKLYKYIQVEYRERYLP